MTTIENPRPSPWIVSILTVLTVWLASCAEPHADHDTPTATPASWSVTAWGTDYEIFPEAPVLTEGKTITVHTHVTRLRDAAPLTAGRVELILRNDGAEQIVAANSPDRPGIFSVEVRPASAGDFDLAFRIRENGQSDEIRGGRIRVGSADQAGGLLVAPAPRGATDRGEPVEFSKEEQWRSDLTTEWVRDGRLAASVSGYARVRPPAGGESQITAPFDGVLSGASTTWPHVGLHVQRGAVLFRIIPRIASGRSLADLEADVRTLEAERRAARDRLDRLRELYDLQATSQREVEDAEVVTTSLDARHAAASADLEAARSSRGGTTSSKAIELRAPFAGQVAEVDAMPGATVDAGQTLAQILRTDTAWIAVDLTPTDARRVEADGVRGLVLSAPEAPPIRLEDGLRWISIAPRVSPRTGLVTVILESPSTAGLRAGDVFGATLRLDEDHEGIVIPSSALVDDGGVTIVYLQLSGERFARQEVRVLERQGEDALVERLTPGQRLVVHGGAAIRRASLLSSGSGHGHVH